MAWYAATAGVVGAFFTINRQWTLTLNNRSGVSLIPIGTSESSGSLSTHLREVRPGTCAQFIWKKAAGSLYGAVGAIHFKIGNTNQIFTVFGCIPLDMESYKPGCNIHIGTYKPSADNLENGMNGCQYMLPAGQFGTMNGCTYTISNKGEAEFIVDFNY